MVLETIWYKELRRVSFKRRITILNALFMIYKAFFFSFFAHLFKYFLHFK